MKPSHAKSYWRERIGLAILLSAPAAVALFAITGVACAVLVGPWGGAIEGMAEDERLRLDGLLSAVLIPLVLVGSLVVGWAWAGRLIARKERAWGSSQNRWARAMPTAGKAEQRNAADLR